MKLKALIRTRIPCLLSALILAALGAQGCQSDHAGDQGSSDPCDNGVCDSCKKSAGSSEEGDICQIGGSPVCVGDLMTNKDHCGSCGHACDPGQSCVNGECEDQQAPSGCDSAKEIPCMDGDTTVCVPKLSNESCGTKECTNKEEGKFCKCEDIVKGQTCEGNLRCSTNGECVCPEGLFQDKTNKSQCNSPENPATCGASKGNPAGTPCREDQICNGKECACIEGIECGGKCIDPLKEHDFCGLGESCDQLVQCNDDETCTQGACVCTNPLQAKCGTNGACIDVDTNITHCGAKGSCVAESYLDDNFMGFLCTGSGRTGCNHGSCACVDGYVFDKATKQCVGASSSVTSCGTDTDNLMNCQLLFGNKAECNNGHCGCKIGWIAIDNTLSWYKDLSDKDKRIRCIDPYTDNEFCGATSENRGNTCKDGNICVNGSCQYPDECDVGVGRAFLLCGKNDDIKCLLKSDFKISNCDKCNAEACSYTGLAKDGCLGIKGVNCACEDGHVEVDFKDNDGKYQACASWTDLNKRHIVVSSGTNSQLICEDGWSDNLTENHYKDGSLRFVSDGVCSIHIGNDLNNCGEVGRVCESANDQHMVTPVCNAGVCQFGACEANYGDCNEDMLSEKGDGCETLLNTTSNCGACGKECGNNRVCSDGVCCIGEGIVTDDVKSHDCCSGLKKYSKCTLNMGILGCLTRSYQCAATQPEGYEEWE